MGHKRLEIGLTKVNDKFLDDLRELVHIRFTGILSYEVEISNGGIRYVTKKVEEKLQAS